MECGSGSSEGVPFPAGRRSWGRRVGGHTLRVEMIRCLGGVQGIDLYSWDERDLRSGEPLDDMHGAVAQWALPGHRDTESDPLPGSWAGCSLRRTRIEKQ